MPTEPAVTLPAEIEQYIAALKNDPCVLSPVRAEAMLTALATTAYVAGQQAERRNPARRQIAGKPK